MLGVCRQLAIMALGLVAAMVCTCTFAATCTWTGAAGDGKWDTEGNWENGQKPTNGRKDDVFLSGVGLVDGAMENNIGELVVNKIRVTGSTPVVLNSAYTIGFKLTNSYFIQSDPFLTLNADITKTEASGMYFTSGAALNGDVSLVGSFNVWINGQQNVTIDFNGAINGPNATVEIWSGAGSSVNFNGKVALKRFKPGQNYNAHKVYFNAPGNEIETLSLAFTRVFLEAANALSTNTVITWDRYHTVNGDERATYFLNGAQQADRIQSDPLPAGAQNIEHIRTKSGTSGASLTLYGSADAVTYADVRDDVSVVWNPTGDFTQEFRDRVSNTSGSLAVSNGTLRVAGTASFPNVPAVVVGPGGTFEVASSVAALTGLSRLTVASGGVFRISTDVNPFATTSVAEVCLGKDARLIVPAGMFVNVGSLSVDGVLQPGGVVEAEGGGTIVVADQAPAPQIAVGATWDGGAGVDRSALTAANWSGDTLPDFASGGLVATFAMGGDIAEFSGGEMFKGVVFDGSDGFYVAAPSEITVLDSGVSTTAPSGETRRYGIDAPVRMLGGQTWSIGPRTTLELSGALAQYDGQTVNIHGSDTEDPSGKVILGGTNFVAGELNLQYARLDIKGTADEPAVLDGGSGTLKALFNHGALLNLSNAVVRKDMNLTFNDRGSVFRVSEASTNYIAGSVEWVGMARPTVAAGATLFFDGGINSRTWVVLNGSSSGSFVVRGKPYVQKDDSANRLQVYSARLSLEAASNSISRLDLQGSGVVVHLGVDDAIASTNTVISFYGTTGTALLDLDGHSQKCGSILLNSSATSSQRVHSDGDATLEFWQWTDSATTTIDITGRVSLLKRGPAAFTVSRPISSVGDVTVESGVMSFDKNGSWRNGTNVTVRGSGRLSLATSRTFGRQSVVRVETGEGAAISLGDGVLQRVDSLYVDGVRQPDGFYGGSGSSAQHKPAWIEGDGSGVLRVGKFGSMLIVY
ncbi:MAG: hypothetical protein IJG84_04080 [Kiritimatiellae bacterium]|nr:hypothetical protein [Kiritimatiellia bacterium]